MTVPMFGPATHTCPQYHMKVTTHTLGPRPACSQCGLPLVPIEVAAGPPLAPDGMPQNAGEGEH